MASAVNLHDRDNARVIQQDRRMSTDAATAIIVATNGTPTPVVTVDGATLSHEQFEQRFRHQRPVRIRNGAQHWSALAKWSDPSLLTSIIERSLPDAARVPVLVAKDNQHFFKNALCTEEHRPLNAIVHAIFTDPQPPQRLYCRLPLLDSLLADIELPVGLVGASVFKPANCGVWMSARGNVTPLHYDLCHGFLVQVCGRKKWTLFSPDDYRLLYPSSSIDPNPLSSQVTIDAWLAGDPHQRQRFPKVAEAERFEVVLEPGDMMYTPPFWWHLVETLEPSVSVLLPWDKRPEEPVHPCAM